MSEESGLFSYPEGWQDVLASLDFLPQEQREFFLQQMVSTVCFGLI